MKGQSFSVPLLMSLASADWIQCFQLLPRLLLSVLLLASHRAQHIGPVMSQEDMGHPQETPRDLFL